MPTEGGASSRVDDIFTARGQLIALQAREAARVGALLQQRDEKERQLSAARRRQEHDNRRRMLERSLDLYDKRSKVR